MDEASASCEQRLSFENITEANVHHLRKMNASVFPVRYHDKFYADIVRGDPNFNQYVFADGVVVGGVCCRIEPSESLGGHDRHDRLYIMTLGVLATWRRRGIGSKLLSHVLANLEQHPSVGEVYLHVQTSNEEAVHFYKVHGFDIAETIANYYKRIDPPDCHVLRKKLHLGT